MITFLIFAAGIVLLLFRSSSKKKRHPYRRKPANESGTFHAGKNLFEPGEKFHGTIAPPGPSINERASATRRDRWAQQH